MAERQNPESQRVAAPILVSPQEEEVVDGQAVRFEWEGIPEGVDYRLQVATDASFDELVVDQPVGDATTHTVTDRFEADERTLYWRVLATDRKGKTSGYEGVESFISSTEGGAAQHVQRPDQEEDLGPYGELFPAAATEAAASATGSEEMVAREAEMGVQHEGIEAGQILGIALATVAALVAAIITLFVLFEREQRLTIGEQAGSIVYPELRDTEAEGLRQITQYGVVDAEEEVYRVPVQRAIELMVNEAYQDTGRTYSPELQLRPGN